MFSIANTNPDSKKAGRNEVTIASRYATSCVRDRAEIRMPQKSAPTRNRQPVKARNG